MKEPETEFILPDSGDEDDRLAAADTIHLVPPKMWKALDHEIPWDLIPPHQHKLYEEAMAKSGNHGSLGTQSRGRSRRSRVPFGRTLSSAAASFLTFCGREQARSFGSRGACEEEP